MYRSPPEKATGAAGPVVCAVCQRSDYSPGSMPVTTQCAHIFHRECLTQWLERQPSCPVCRRDCSLDECRPHQPRGGAVPRTRSGGMVTRSQANRQPTTPMVSPARPLDQTHTVEGVPAASQEPSPEPSVQPNSSSNVQALLAGLRGELADLITRQVTQQLQNLHLPPPEAPAPTYRPPGNRQFRFGESEVSRHQRSRRRSASPMRHWKLVYDGDNSRLRADEFLFRAEVMARNTLGGEYDLMAENLATLLQNRPLEWYWQYLRFHPEPRWDDLKLAFRRDWTPPVHDTDILRQMLSRRQQSGEPFQFYLQDLQSLRQSLRMSMPEVEFLEIVKDNLLPATQQHICLHPVYSIEQLQALVMPIEGVLQRTRAMRYATNIRRLEEVDDGSARHWQMEQPDMTPDSDIPNCDTRMEDCSTVSRVDPCWNCGQTGHWHRQCPSPNTGVYCYGCGLRDVYINDCKNCSRKNLRRGGNNSSSSRQNPPQSPSNRRAIDQK